MRKMNVGGLVEDAKRVDATIHTMATKTTERSR